jgi:hypothetical protein
MLTSLPPLVVADILAWADSHHARTGCWPGVREPDTTCLPPGETWHRIDTALRRGRRGLPGGSSLPQLLARERGARNPQGLPDLSEEQVASWGLAHRMRTGAWPTEKSGPVAGAPGETWYRIDRALRTGGRGLPGDDSLPRLLARRLGARTRACLPRLMEWLILRWADEHRGRTGRWPSADSGPVAADPGESWQKIDRALREGFRGLPGGDSLARLLRRNRCPSGKRRRRRAVAAGVSHGLWLA